MNYKELTPKTIQKLREFMGWFGTLRDPELLEFKITSGIKTETGFRTLTSLDTLEWETIKHLVHPCVLFEKEGIFHLPEDMRKEARNLKDRVDETVKSLPFEYKEAKDALKTVQEILKYIDNDIPFDPCQYTKAIQIAGEVYIARYEQEKMDGELLTLILEVVDLKREVKCRQGVEILEIHKNAGKPTQTSASDSTEVGTVIAFLILLGSVIAFITYVKTF